MPETYIRAWGVEIEAGWRPCDECLESHYASITTSSVCDYCNTPLKKDTDYLIEHMYLTCEKCNNKNPAMYTVSYHNCMHFLPKPLACGWHIDYDGTINIRGKEPSKAHEIKTYPPATDREKLENDLILMFSSINEINDSMGMHIHVSYPKWSTYRAIASWAFVNQFQQGLEKAFPEVWDRINSGGWARMYTDEYNFDRECWGRRAVNTLAAFNRHGTNEFRAFGLPKTGERAVEYVRYLDSNITNFMHKVESREIVPISKFPANRSEMQGTFADVNWNWIS